ncbi:hypothetical protein D3C86_1080250 [compost metagenome]
MRRHAAAQRRNVHGKALADAHVDAHGGPAVGQVHQHHPVAPGLLPQGRGDVVAFGQFLQMRAHQAHIRGLLQGSLGQLDQPQAHAVGLGGLVESHQPFMDQGLQQIETGAGVQAQVLGDSRHAVRRRCIGQIAQDLQARAQGPHQFLGRRRVVRGWRSVFHAQRAAMNREGIRRGRSV